MVNNVGLLIIEGDLSPNRLKQILAHASSLVSSELYFVLRTFQSEDQSNGSLKQFITLVYSYAPSICPNLGIYISLPPFVNKICNYDVIITVKINDNPEELVTKVKHIDENFDPSTMLSDSLQVFRQSRFKAFQSVCLGGTFDDLHNGHRLLLTLAALLAESRLLVGVTDNRLLKGKILAPLIQNSENRAAGVKNFLEKIGFDVNRLEIFFLTDPFGPPVYQPDFDCIVASEETVPGCEKINQMRSDKGFSPLHIEKVDFVVSKGMETLLPKGYTDSKISSSSLRLNLLGRCLLREYVEDRQPKGGTWIIGLTGCIASGKSSILKLLRDFSGDRIRVIDVDHLLELFCNQIEGNCENLRTYFAMETVKQLDASLNMSTYEKTEILSKIQSEIDIVLSETRSKQPVIFLEGSLLFTTGLNYLCDEMWTVYVPRSVALSRVAKRREIKLVEEIEEFSSELKVDWWAPCQRDSGRVPIGQSSVVFCTLWDEEFTRKQTERAWKYLSQRLL
nr:dephospho coenzyme A related kinases [Hymenolepis microstoma]